MVLRLDNGDVHVVRELNDFKEVVEPAIFEALCELVQDKPVKETQIDYERMAEVLLR